MIINCREERISPKLLRSDPPSLTIVHNSLPSREFDIPSNRMRERVRESSTSTGHAKKKKMKKKWKKESSSLG